MTNESRFIGMLPEALLEKYQFYYRRLGVSKKHGRAAAAAMLVRAEVDALSCLPDEFAAESLGLKEALDQYRVREQQEYLERLEGPPAPTQEEIEEALAEFIEDGLAPHVYDPDEIAEDSAGGGPVG